MKKDWSRDPLPVGTIRMRRKNGGVRVIKIRMDGPRSRRWIQYARWWWEKNRGPVPAGKWVCHVDGNSLNDDPSNYALLTPGDVVFMAHDRDPKMSARNYAKASAATAYMNRQRALCRRMRGELNPRSWYAVDARKRLIYNLPKKKRWQVYAAFGYTDKRANGRVVGTGDCPIISLRGEHLIRAPFDSFQKVTELGSTPVGERPNAGGGREQHPAFLRLVSNQSALADSSFAQLEVASVP